MSDTTHEPSWLATAGKYTLLGAATAASVGLFGDEIGEKLSKLGAENADEFWSGLAKSVGAGFTNASKFVTNRGSDIASVFTDAEKMTDIQRNVVAAVAAGGIGLLGGSLLHGLKSHDGDEPSQQAMASLPLPPTNGPARN